MTLCTRVVPSVPPFLTIAWITSRKVSMPTSSPWSMTTSEPMSCWDMTLSAAQSGSSGRHGEERAALDAQDVADFHGRLQKLR